MDLTSLALSVALGYSQYTGNEAPTAEPSFRVQVGSQEKPYYAFGGYESFTPRLLGQGVADVDLFTVGVGARKTLGDFFGFFEIGYGVVDEDPKMTIQQEVVHTALVQRHATSNTPPPVNYTQPYCLDCYETSYELDGGLLGEVGIGYRATDQLSLTGSYRAFYVDEHMELWDEENRANGGGWWQETRSRDLSSVVLRVVWEF